MSTSTTPPRLGRCKEKGCKHAVFLADDSMAVHASTLNEVKADGRVYKVGNGSVGTISFLARCPDRHKVFALKQIKGTYSKDHKCDARCLNAKGHECTCSCGGANHGRGYATEVVEASATPVVTERYESDSFPSQKQISFIKSLLAERELPPTYTSAGECEMTGEDRVERCIEMLDNGEMTKRQASKTIEWLLTLPRKS